MKSLFKVVQSFSPHALSFVAWWFRELAGFFPQRIFFGEGRTAALVRLGPESSEILFKDRHGKELDRFNVGKEFRTALDSESVLLRNRLAGSSIELSLVPGEVCLLEWQQLGDRRPTRDSVRYRLLQESPVDAGSVEFDWRTKVAHGTSGDQPFVQVALCRRRALTNAIEQSRNLGLDPTLIGFASPQNISLDWVFARPNRNAAFSVRAHKKKLLLISLIVWPLLAMSLVGLIATLELRSVQSELEERRKSLQGSEILLRRQADLSSAYGALRQAATVSSYTNAIDELGGLLPHEAWFTELRIEGHSIRIVGFGADPTKAVKALAKGAPY